MTNHEKYLEGKPILETILTMSETSEFCPISALGAEAESVCCEEFGNDCSRCFQHWLDQECGEYVNPDSPRFCPFCGSHDVRLMTLEGAVNEYKVECCRCHCATPWHNQPQRVLNIWNTRIEVTNLGNQKGGC